MQPSPFSMTALIGRLLISQIFLFSGAMKIVNWSATAAQMQEKGMFAVPFPGPVVVEAVVDPHEPPMPPQATLGQAWKLAQSLARGTPDRAAILGTILKDKLHELV